MEEAVKTKLASTEKMLLRTSMTQARTAELGRMMTSNGSSGSELESLTPQQKANRENNLLYLKKADEELNSAYHAALAALGPAEQAKLRQDKESGLPKPRAGFPSRPTEIFLQRLDSSVLDLPNSEIITPKQPRQLLTRLPESILWIVLQQQFPRP
jgi:hypothetical protein